MFLTNKIITKFVWYVGLVSFYVQTVFIFIVINKYNQNLCYQNNVLVSKFFK